MFHMVAENRQETTADRVVEFLERVHNRFNAVETRIRAFTPTVVRAVEILLAIALFVGIVRWFYLFSIS